MINILEILKKIPNLEDMVFYSPIYGNVKVRIGYTAYNGETLIEIYTEFKVPFLLNKYGQRDKEGECLLYPSRQNRDWSTFKIPRKDLPEGTSVMVSDTKMIWMLRKYIGNKKCYSAVDDMACISWEYIIPVDKFNFKDWTFKEEDNYGTTHKE